MKKKVDKGLSIDSLFKIFSQNWISMDYLFKFELNEAEKHAKQLNFIGGHEDFCMRVYINDAVVCHQSGWLCAQCMHSTNTYPIDIIYYINGVNGTDFNL